MDNPRFRDEDVGAQEEPLLYVMELAQKQINRWQANCFRAWRQIQVRSEMERPLPFIGYVGYN